MEWLKSVWAKWKVQVSVVGGVLVIGTAYGTCSVEPPAVEEPAVGAVESSANTNTANTSETLTAENNSTTESTTNNTEE